jgi:hypothetical protein
MRCERCQGSGSISQPVVCDGEGRALGLPSMEPCPECCGCGQGYCCEGAANENCPPLERSVLEAP